MNLTANRDRVRAALGQPPRRWYEITNAGDRAVVRIYDEISWLGITAEQFAADLDKITANEIEVQINSPGGNVFDGITIYNTLRNHPARVTARVVGLAASIASVIVQAADRRIMAESGQMMVHRASGVTIGNADDHDDMADVLRQQDDVIAGIYARRGSRSVAKYRQMMDAETWLTADEAVDQGLADIVAGEPSNRRSGQGSDHRAELELLGLELVLLDL